MPQSRRGYQWPRPSWQFLLLPIALTLMPPGTAGASDAPYTLVSSNSTEGLRVSDQTQGNQADSAIAMDAIGDFVVSWSSETADLDNSAGIAARRYGANGVPLGASFRVNTYSAGVQSDSDIAMAPDGRFVVVWTSLDQDGSGAGIYAQRYAADGQRKGVEFRVNRTVSGNQSSPSLAAGTDGSFVVVWTSDGQDGAGGGIYAQRFSPQGKRVGAEFRINSERSANDVAPAIAMDAQNRFVVVWRRVQGDSSSIVGRRYAADGNATSDEFVVTAPMPVLFQAPSIASDAAGDFVVAWSRLDGQADAPEDSMQSIHAQRYAASGEALGGEFEPALNYSQTEPAVAMDAQGEFVLAWKSYQFPSGAIGSILFQLYDANGVAQGSARSIDGDKASNIVNKAAAVAMDADGDIVLSWDGAEWHTELNLYTIFATRYCGATNVDLSPKLSATPDPVARGGELNYQLRVSNLYAAANTSGVAAIDSAIGAATSIELSLPKPVYSSYLRAEGEGWACSDQSTTLECALTTPLRAASDSVLNLVFTAPGVAGTLPASGTVQADQYDSRGGNNSGSTSSVVETPSEPYLFDFPDYKNAGLQDNIISGNQKLSGISSSVPVAVVGGEYRINKGSWTKAPGQAVAGDKLQLRTLSSSSYSTPVTMQITVGNVYADWTVITMAESPPP